MSTVPLCSVIVPLYRHDAFVAECLDSILNQTYPRLELILIDDASPDRSFERAQAMLDSAAYRSRFARLVCRRKPENAGAHDSLNQGIAEARGDYLAIINSDDAYDSQRLAIMIAALQDSGRGLAYSAIEPVYEPGSRPHRGFTRLLNFIEFVLPQLPSRSFGCLMHNAALTTGNFVLRRDFAAKVGPFAALQLAHDWDFLLRATILEEPLFVDRRLYRYRLHAENTFAALEDRARAERETCIARYFRRIAAAPPQNPLAPNPYHWPQLFEHFVFMWGWERLWHRYAHGHVAEGRTERARSPVRPSTLK